MSLFLVLTILQVDCSFARGEETTWLHSLPANVRDQIVWSADYETLDLEEWRRSHAVHPGSGIFNTGSEDALARATSSIVHSGRGALETTIRNAYRAVNGPRAVRMMIWTDRPWDDGGRYLPARAYYSTWIYFPHAYDPAKRPPADPGDGGWWNVMQFKSEDRTGQSQPVWTLNVSRAAADELLFYLYSPANRPASYAAAAGDSFPAREWLHVEVFYVSALGTAGQIDVYQNGKRIIEASHVVTSLGGTSGRDVHPIWGLGNYTDHITGDPDGPGRATVVFDDTAISAAPLAPYARRQRSGGSAR